MWTLLRQTFNRGYLTHRTFGPINVDILDYNMKKRSAINKKESPTRNWIKKIQTNVNSKETYSLEKMNPEVK